MKTIKNPFTILAGKCLALLLLGALLTPEFTYADDSATVQAMINAGTAFPAGKTYTVSISLLVNKNVNFNGDIINWAGTAGGCLKIQTAGVIVQNGTITGTWTPTGAYNNAGPSGIVIYADNVTVSKMTIQNVTAYGIVVSGARNNPIITYNKIVNCGYICFYYDSEAATTGGTFSFNTCDRSQIPPANVHELAVGIRAVSSGTTPLTTGWTVNNNTITMPLNPTDWTAECIEVRTVANCVISGNTFNQSSIGVSIARSSGVTVTNNKFSGAQLEAIEIEDSKNTATNNNIIAGGIGIGILLDGAVGSSNTTITGDNISGMAKDCIQSVAGTNTVKVINAKLSAGTNAKAFNLIGTTGVTVTGTTMTGNSSAGQMAVYLTNCAGGLTINGATISNFAKCLVYISNTTSGMVTNNVNVSGNVVTGVPTALSTYLTNGGSVGSAVTVTLK
ncbi:MAG TPA: right-handed parallel beta-helix repeat-containing protein [Mucilaginibacter sp.]|jgi:parallel beta-helix repeat protein|nr:right-handed parallel beta-helix repeat-containing protein [Mucilaginibacter sp.]